MKLGLALCAAAIALCAYNILISYRAAADSNATLENLTGISEDVRDGSGISPDTPMPVEMVDGMAYVGVLRIPTLDLELPVLSEWSYPGLRVAPCRYSGSVYSDDMVLAAHNYPVHFGRFGSLSYGDEVTFMDVEGNLFAYEVSSIEELGPYDVDDMIGSNWDLTLFTCTLGGASRVTVRCSELEPSAMMYISN